MPLRDLQKPVPWALLYADDVMLACEGNGDLERQMQAWCDHLAMFGLKLNVRKTEYLTTDENKSGSIMIGGIELARSECSLVQVAFADWRALRKEGTRAPEVEDLQSSRPAGSDVRS
ncbi:unnamed protein product [Heligmosomoides polygyrus]|uniref:Reverse transcriptase domain-containing protein n=1 Tax=Heligmosomoides polygyrus TaxID=6339 RepID=A0A183GMQ1_HELPZ|nr:unnamed protein product [Heligmosomoides polygyrus]